MHLPGPSSGSLPACLHDLLAVHLWTEHPWIPLCTFSSYSGFAAGMILHLMQFLCCLVGLVQWRIHGRAACTSRVDRGIASERWKRKGGPSSVARAPSSIFRSLATRPRCVHQLVTPGPPRSLLARGDGTKCIGATMVAFGSTTGTSHACFVTYASLHSTRACARRAVLVAPLGCVHVRWPTSLPRPTPRFTTVYNGSQQGHNPSQPGPGRPLHNASQRICPPRPSIPWIALPILLASSWSILVVPARFSWSFPAPVPCSSTTSTVLRTCSWWFRPPTNAEGIRPSAVASC